MIQFEAEVTNKVGMHLRAAGEFVNLATKFDSEVFVIKDGRKANGKSILGLASLAIEPGAMIIIEIDGGDESEARDAIEELIKNKFYEE